MTDLPDDIDRTIKREIGERIRDRREALGLSQWQLAQQLEMRQDEISRWEIGRVRPSGRNLRLLANALDCPWRALAYGPVEDAA